MKKSLTLGVVVALSITGCSVSRVQTNPGEMSIDKNVIYSNAALIYDENRLGVCSISALTENESGAYSIAVDDLENQTSVVCTKNQKKTASRDIKPVLWKTKYDKANRSAKVSSFIFGGPLALAVNAAMTPSNPEMEDVAAMHRIYPPFLAIRSDNPSKSEKTAILKKLNQKYDEYEQNLPKDCDNWNQREFNALCEPVMINLLKDHEAAYVNGVQFTLPEEIKEREEDKPVRKPVNGS